MSSDKEKDQSFLTPRQAITYMLFCVISLLEYKDSIGLTEDEQLFLHKIVEMTGQLHSRINDRL